MLKGWYKFINETKMTPEKEGMNLELTDKFKNRPDSPFNYYFKTGLNDTHYFVFSSITYDEYQPAGNRVTFLKKTTFLDTVDGRPNYSLRDPNIFSNNDYYFYILTSTQRRNLGEKGSETHGITINLDKDPRRFSVQRTEDGKKHFVVIEKDDNATSVRLNSGKSRFDALGAEKVIQTKFGWNRNQKSIKKRLIKYQTNDNGEIIPDRYQEATLHDIMASSEYTNIFDIENPDETLSKYDLIAKGKYKIEVKKYSIKDLYTTNGDLKVPKYILLAEQLKISTKDMLMELVKYYRDIVGENEEVRRLILLDRNQLSSEFSVRNINNQTINNIRNFYNQRIEYMKIKYENIPNNKIMEDIYGIYFFNLRSGIDGFLIKIFDNGVNNFTYKWETISSHWGLLRLRLMFKVNLNAYRYIWLGDEEEFIKTYKIKNEKPISKQVDLINPVIKYTEIGNIKFDHSKGYWIRDERSRGKDMHKLSTDIPLPIPTDIEKFDPN